MNTTEIRAWSPKVGFWTETVGTAGQAAINIVKSRVPDAHILSMKYHTETERRDERTDTRGRR